MRHAALRCRAIFRRCADMPIRRHCRGFRLRHFRVFADALPLRQFFFMMLFAATERRRRHFHADDIYFRAAFPMPLSPLSLAASPYCHADFASAASDAALPPFFFSLSFRLRHAAASPPGPPPAAMPPITPTFRRASDTLSPLLSFRHCLLRR